MSVENTRLGYKRIAELLKGCKSVYFIGIGGINMSSLAHITKNMGYEVAGSDRTETELTKRLQAQGIRINYSHSRENAEGFDAFVYTVAISPDNPEYRYAVDNGLPCISRADYLGYIMTRYKRRIGIAGMHGKSSCTSMCAEALIKCGAEPTVLSGAELPIMNGAYCVRGDENFVFEACEYMDSFLHFNPSVAVILNIEMDHVDYFKSMEQIRESFYKYASLVGREGAVIYNADDAEVCRALDGVEARMISFGVDTNDATYRAENITSSIGGYSFDVIFDEKKVAHIDLTVTGYHNIYNALAAFAACRECGVPDEELGKALGGFGGACRRMEYKGSVGGARVYDDYGHHPTEIRATLSGAKSLCEDGGRLFCVYQPHTYSRTAALIDEFATAFDACDRVIFADIYAAREINTFGVSSELLATMVGDKATYAGGFSDSADLLSNELRTGDVCVVMGAGDIYKVFDYLNFE